MIPKKIDLSFPVAIGTGPTFYAVVPCRCTVTDVKLAVSIDPGDGDTVTVTSGGTAIGVVALGTGIAAGDIGVYTTDATTGDTVLAAGATLKFVVSTCAAATHLVGYAEIDPHARVSQ
ncbi:MAG: hypothetical protein GY820_38950 [Gammaproteobacteria bacterium]|nr:hypothetical protein [Gammaproteobacteria bacterium]